MPDGIKHVAKAGSTKRCVMVAIQVGLFVIVLSRTQPLLAIAGTHQPQQLSLHSPFLPPGRVLLLSGDKLHCSKTGRTVQLRGSQLCSLESAACWGEKLHAPARETSSYLIQESFVHLNQQLARLCIYWGSPNGTHAMGWCEQLPWCLSNLPMTLQLDPAKPVAGEERGLIGVCYEGGRAVRRWPASQPTPSLIGNGAAEPAELVFSGIAYKTLNGPILSAGRALVSRSSHEYRVTSFEWYLDYSHALKPGEWVESDVCLTLFAIDKERALCHTLHLVPCPCNLNH
mmetsp:Transcript_2142/g.6069  ORF Transcript_2142/g.6069 Transcript_2142/m.6069 type:complete len:286 (+) Transcript_2142:15-872(+)